MSDISELFSRDPLEHTDESIDEIIRALRESRRTFVTGALKTPATKAAKPGKSAKLSIDLGIKL